MSLVAYGSSDDEGSSDEISPQLEESELIPVRNSSENTKKPRESVKITIPSLKEFEDEEGDVPKKKPKFQTKSGFGLFSLLPPPKNSTTLSKPGFVPYILSKKEQKKPSAPPSIKKLPVTNKTNNIRSNVSSIDNEADSVDDTTVETEPSGDDEQATTAVDFFSLESKPEPVSDSLDALSNASNSEESNCNIFKSSNMSSSHVSESFSTDPTSIQEEIETVPYAEQYQGSSSNFSAELAVDFPQTSEPPNPVDALLNDKEFLKIQGRRREFENIDIIDVNAADQLLDQNEWLMKSLTEETAHRPSRKKHNMPTSLQKRKHQITYLAFQAKEREMDLKNQWASNNRTRRETQAKYGF